MADSEIAAWASCGAMALTGRADGPPSVAPAGVATAARAVAADVARMTARVGRSVVLDGAALLGERAAIAGFGRRGAVSVGGAARFERASDGWVVLNLPRPDDVRCLPALLEADVDTDDWPSIAALVAARSSAGLVERGRLLGLAISAPDECPPASSPVRVLTQGCERTPVDRPLVVDLTSLWAGPLAGSILVAAGARVIKVEGRGRPDGARVGPKPFFDLMNAGKETLMIDFSDRADLRLLRTLMERADLVIEASRPRVMEQLGIRPAALAVNAATSWISITGHGRTDDPTRIGFGDDAAVAGGLWVDEAAGPAFVADAVADPLTGMVAGALGAELLAGDRATVVDVPLARVAARAASSPVGAPVSRAGVDGWVVEAEDGPVDVALPRARPALTAAAPADAHGSALRAEFA